MRGNDGPLSEMREGREIQIMECDLSILKACKVVQLYNYVIITPYPLGSWV